MGRFMGANNRDEQAEVFGLLALEPGEQVLEAGYGPGVLAAMMLAAGATVGGVDPSREMQALARRRNERAVAAGTADLRVGTAGDTGFPDASFDAAVSVNNVPMWTDLDEGMRELRRVVRPGGRVVVAWHGGAQPRFVARRLVLPGNALDTILASMRAAFGSGERYDGQRIVAFQASVRP